MAHHDSAHQFSSPVLLGSPIIIIPLAFFLCPHDYPTTFYFSSLSLRSHALKIFSLLLGILCLSSNISSKLLVVVMCLLGYEYWNSYDYRFLIGRHLVVDTSSIIWLKLTYFHMLRKENHFRQKNHIQTDKKSTKTMNLWNFCFFTIHYL